jgi:hypothetical protein
MREVFTSVVEFFTNLYSNTNLFLDGLTRTELMSLYLVVLGMFIFSTLVGFYWASILIFLIGAARLTWIETH